MHWLASSPSVCVSESCRGRSWIAGLTVYAIAASEREENMRPTTSRLTSRSFRVAGFMPRSTTVLMFGSALLLALWSTPISTGAAQFFFAQGTAYSSGNQCVLVYSQFWGHDGAIRVTPATLSANCSNASPIPLPAGKLGVAYTLWGWNGTEPYMCTTQPSYSFSTASNYRFEISLDLPACGDGWYVLASHGTAFVDGAWRSLTVFTDWKWFDVDDSPPILE